MAYLYGYIIAVGPIEQILLEPLVFFLFVEFNFISKKEGEKKHTHSQIRAFVEIVRKWLTVFCLPVIDILHTLGYCIILTGVIYLYTAASITLHFHSLWMLYACAT